MAIITSDAITADNRRARIRELADITSVTIDDGTLDARIEHWDEVAITQFQLQGQTPDTSAAYFRNLITVANLLTSVSIRQSLGGQDNMLVAKDQTELWKSIVLAQNLRGEEQGTDTILKTTGVDRYNAYGDFN